MRIYDPRLGRFLSVDPYSCYYPWNSSYAYAENDVIRCGDLDGLEKLILTVTSNPNSETGEPGKAKLEIVREYKVITDGFASVPDASKLDPKVFANLYKRGDVTLFVTSLPTAQGEPSYLEGKMLRLAQKAESGDEKAREKLKSMGVNYYVMSVTYQYKLIIEPGTDLCAGMDWAKMDFAGRALVLMSIRWTDAGEFINLSSQSGSETEFGELWTLNTRMLEAKQRAKDAEMAGNVSLMGNEMFIQKHVFIYSDYWIRSSLANSVVYRNYNGEIIGYHPTETENLAHEGGHNSTELSHGEGYDYEDEGLSSNLHGSIYPTTKNTKAIIKNNLKNLNKNE